ncbi:MAG: ATP-binding protein [Desulfobacterales bacterium]|nr:ATP-binding protein [Desulfobacterales bacterium]
MEKFLPAGVQVFEKMITGNFLYVDKTRYIYEMVRPPQAFFFLARPRRFGKSLLVSTLDSLFKGQKELFKDLWIEKSDWQWKKHPVIKVDFSQINSKTPEQLEESLIFNIHRLSKEHNIDNSSRSLPDCFVRYIVELSKKHNENAVILIDEYDKPLIDHLGKGEDHLSVAKENRDILKQFFGVLKGGDVSSVLRFVFITGISKFARVSIFSDLNNLDDISMQEEYDAILGYTDDELLSLFDTHIYQLKNKLNLEREETIKRIQNWYNGYRFTDSKTKVYNPFSVIKLFQKRKFENFWFETATPSFLLNLIKEQEYPVPDIENLLLSRENFTVYDIEDLQLEPLLFQTGYISIQHFDDILYKMGYPNQEVKVSFLSYLYHHFVRIKNKRIHSAYKLLHIYLDEKRIEDFIETVKSILASIPYTQIASQGEDYYHTAFYLMLSASGALVRTEVLTSQGRLDIAVEFDDKVYVIELKCNQSSEKAVRQILDKKYYEKYMKTGRNIYLMGIGFDTEKRTIEDWQWGELEGYLDDCSDEVLV